MDVPRAVLLSIVVSLAIVGAVLYALDALRLTRTSYTLEELQSMDKNALIALILSNRASGGPAFGRLVFPAAVILAAVLSAVIACKLVGPIPNRETILRLLRDDERKIVEALVKHGGQMRQYELVSLLGNKVRVHRALRALEDRGIVEVEHLGRYNNVVLDPEVYAFLRSAPSSRTSPHPPART